MIFGWKNNEWIKRKDQTSRNVGLSISHWHQQWVWQTNRNGFTMGVSKMGLVVGWTREKCREYI